MTTPDLSFIIPTKWKPWASAIGATLTFVVPYLSGVIAGLPLAGQAAVAAVLAGLTWLGVYQVPYAPKGTVLVPEAAAPSVPPPPAGGYRNPWGA